MDSNASASAFRSILCPVDFSAHSRAALQYAATIGRVTGGRLTAIFVNDPLLVAAAAAAASHDERGLAQTSERELQQFVQRATASTRLPNQQVSVAVVQGEPAREIAKATRRLRADLVVMGSQGLSGASKWFFGSTTERMLRQTRIPVLAVPADGPRLTAKNPWPGKWIVAAIELGPRASRHAMAAAGLASLFGARLLLAHVVTPTAGPRWLTRSLREHDRARIERARTALERVRASLGPGLDVDNRLLVGDLQEQIALAAKDVGAGLIVTTLQRRDVLGRARGSTTYRILWGSLLPVLALPGGSATSAP
jgi:nucleotide-binding universal stress UspA family protein